MASITEKRLSLHKRVQVQEHQNKTLKSQLAQLQPLVNMGTVSYMIAHEINNMLTPLKSYATLALDNLDDKALTEKALGKVVTNCERASKIMDSMLALANGETQEKNTTRLRTLVEEIFAGLCRDFAKDGVVVEIMIPDDLGVWGIPVQIQQVLMNLILNARDAMLARGGVLTIRASDGNGNVQIEVADTGSGIEPGDLENIFDTFFTTKSDKGPAAGRSGAGIGLAFCKMIVDGHDGCVSVESKPGHGTNFKITLPKP
ncbi:MAG: HAMP domain-containing sensor histidine kinase [Planctomycetota bacterium]